MINQQRGVTPNPNTLNHRSAEIAVKSLNFYLHPYSFGIRNGRRFVRTALVHFPYLFHWNFDHLNPWIRWILIEFSRWQPLKEAMSARDFDPNFHAARSLDWF